MADTADTDIEIESPPPTGGSSHRQDQNQGQTFIVRGCLP